MTGRLNLRFDEICRRYGTAPAITDAQTTLTYEALLARADALASDLQGASIETDEPIIVAMSNHACDFAALFAVWKAGGVAVPVHRRSSAPAVSGILTRTCARLIVNAQPSEALAGLDAGPETVLRLSDSPPPHRELLQDAAWILFTSGSTGDPKGVVHGHDTYLAKLDAINEAMELAPPQRVLLPLQPTFAYAQWVALTTLLQGGEVVIANPFDPEIFAQQLQQDITATAVVPTMLRKLRPLIESHQCAAFSGVVMTGGEPLPAELGTFIRHQWPGSALWDVYGLTETATSDFYVRPDEHDIATGKIGRPAPGIAFRIDPNTDELQIRTPFLMRGYLDAPDLTDAALADGYFRTDDQARVKDDGTVEITGRLSDIVNRGGNKIAPLEIERVFSQHADVVDALATGLPDKETGEALHIAVVAKPNATLDAQALRSWVAGQMDRHKLPDRIHLVEALPTGNTGKADRNALRNQLTSMQVDDTAER